MRKVINYTNIEELKEFEIVDQNVSVKYVPIFSSEIIKLLEPDFKFVSATKFGAASSAHYFDLVREYKGKETFLRVYNSYDRSLALRVSLISDGVSIPLGIDRLVHIGARAKTFTEDFTSAKSDITQAIKTAKNLSHFLSTTEIRKETAKRINETIFKINKNLNLVSVNNPVDILIGKASIKEYIKKSITTFLRGDYTYVNTNGKTIKAPKMNTILTRIRTENIILKLLNEEFPELFL